MSPGQTEGGGALPGPAACGSAAVPGCVLRRSGGWGEGEAVVSAGDVEQPVDLGEGEREFGVEEGVDEGAVRRCRS